MRLNRTTCRFSGRVRFSWKSVRNVRGGGGAALCGGIAPIQSVREGLLPGMYLSGIFKDKLWRNETLKTVFVQRLGVLGWAPAGRGAKRE